MRFLLMIASLSARLRAAGQRTRRGLSRAIDENGAGVQRRARADRTDTRWCAAPTPSSSRRPSNRSPSRTLPQRSFRCRSRVEASWRRSFLDATRLFSKRSPVSRARLFETYDSRLDIRGVLFGSREVAGASRTSTVRHLRKKSQSRGVVWGLSHTVG